MKILFSFVLIFVFSFVVFGQTDKTTQKSKSAAASQFSVKLLELRKQRKATEEKLKQLSAKYSEEYVGVVEAKSEIKELDEQISKLSVLEASNSDSSVLEADLNSVELMKIIIIQNQKIIELLEKLVSKK